MPLLTGRAGWVRINSSASRHSRGVPMVLIKSLPVPAGTTPSAVRVCRRPAAVSVSVPSPPKADHGFRPAPGGLARQLRGMPGVVGQVLCKVDAAAFEQRGRFLADAQRAPLTGHGVDDKLDHGHPLLFGKAAFLIYFTTFALKREDTRVLFFSKKKEVP